MDISWCRLHCVYQSCPYPPQHGLYSQSAMCCPLLDLMCILDPAFSPCSGGRRRGNNGGIYDRSLFQDKARSVSAVTTCKQFLRCSPFFTSRVRKRPMVSLFAPDCWNQRRRNLKMPGCRLPPLLLHHQVIADFADTTAAWSPVDRVYCRALLCNSTAGSA